MRKCIIFCIGFLFSSLIHLASAEGLGNELKIFSAIDPSLSSTLGGFSVSGPITFDGTSGKQLPYVALGNIYSLGTCNTFNSVSFGNSITFSQAGTWYLTGTGLTNYLTAKGTNKANVVCIQLVDPNHSTITVVRVSWSGSTYTRTSPSDNAPVVALS